MTSSQVVRNGRKRANSADNAVSAKKVKADQSIVEYGQGSVASRTDYNEANVYTNGGSPQSSRKRKIVGNDVSFNCWSKEVILTAAVQHYFYFGLPREGFQARK